jgi:glutathione S-transferase
MRLARPGFAARSVLRLPLRRALHRLGDPPSGKPVFYDMAHSNNAARIRLWRLLKGGMTEELDRCVVAYPDLKTPAFKVLNPLQKVPALVHADGTTVFESNVILDYLDDKYGAHAPSFKPPTAEGRQLMNLFIRIHDLYIASPNCCAPGFSHCQGAMYLSNGWHGAARGMDLPTREAKIGEIWRQLNWLEAEVTRVHADAGGPGPYMLGEQLTLADLTWFPTCVFMEYMLPRVFGWAPPFAVGEGTPFPALAAWYTHVREAHAEFERTHADIWGYWEELDGQGQFQCIVDEIRAAEEAGEGPCERVPCSACALPRVCLAPRVPCSACALLRVYLAPRVPCSACALLHAAAPLYSYSFPALPHAAPPLCLC